MQQQWASSLMTNFTEMRETQSKNCVRLEDSRSSLQWQIRHWIKIWSSYGSFKGFSLCLLKLWTVSKWPFQPENRRKWKSATENAINVSVCVVWCTSLSIMLIFCLQEAAPALLASVLFFFLSVIAGRQFATLWPVWPPAAGTAQGNLQL